MTFSKVKPTGWQVNEKLTSAQMNSLDTDHSKAIDKTGDNVGSGGGVTGQIDFKSGSTINALSGSTFNLQNGSDGYIATFVQVNGNGTFAGGGFELSNGAVLQIDATGGAAMYCEMDWKLGAVCNFDSGSILEMDSGSHVVGPFDWTASAAAPVFSQDSVGSGTGKDFTISAQATSSGVGGNVVLNSGNGTSSFNYSGVKLQKVGSTGAGLVVYQQTGSPATQRGINGIYECFITTAASGSPIDFFNLNMPTVSGAFIEVCWVRRTTGGSGCLGNKLGIVAVCNGGGTVVWSGPTEYISPTAGFDSASTAFTFSNTANTLQMFANQIEAADWQIIVSVNLS
jgi:hypothetical protein